MWITNMEFQNQIVQIYEIYKTFFRVLIYSQSIYINICIEERKVVADSVDTDIWNAFNSSAISKNRSSE